MVGTATSTAKGFGAQEGAKLQLTDTVVQAHAKPNLVLDPSTLPHCKSYSGEGVVMGMAANYQWGQMDNFVTSLRNTGYKGKIVLGVRGVAGLDVSKDTRSTTKDELTKHCVTVRHSLLFACVGTATSPSSFSSPMHPLCLLL
jgi:hypothetical protein